MGDGKKKNEGIKGIIIKLGNENKLNKIETELGMKLYCSKFMKW